MSESQSTSDTNVIDPSRMSAFIESLIEYRRLAFSLLFLMLAVGVLALGSMARQEDPSFPYRSGLIKVFYPGGTPLQIEKLIMEPIEDELAQVAEIDTVTSTSRDDLAIINIALQDYVYDTDSAWGRVNTAVERARLQFPDGVSRIEIDDRQIDMPAAVLSITGSNDPILLEAAALKLKSHVIGLKGLSRIQIEGVPEKEVIVKVDQETINRLGISRRYIAQLIQQRNNIVPGGLVSSKDKSIRLNTQSDFATLDELRQTLIPLKNGQNVALQTIASVNLEPRLPLAGQTFHNGKRAVSLGIIAQRGQVDLIGFGEQLRARAAQLRPVLAPLKIEESFFQADYTQDRLNGLRVNLFVSVLVIAAIVFFAMGWRTGLLVSAVLPVVSIIAIGVYGAGGGVFHQMAVIGMVISLGILIDNAIVVVEHIEAALRKGVDLAQAIRNVIKIMAKPLFASTGTTIAAFIPLLLAKGGVGDFTRAVPIMIVISLVISYLLSILILPLISFYWLKRADDEEGDRTTKAKSGEMAFNFTNKLAHTSADFVQAGPVRVLVLVAIMLGASLALSPFLKQEFFPSTDRAQIVIELELPNNTPLTVTADISQDIEKRLMQHESVNQVYRHIGGAGFRFYYNMVGAPNESNVARFTVNTRRMQENQPLVDWVRDTLRKDYPDAVLIPRLLGQGPPTLAPIEVRVKHNDLAVLHQTSQKIKALMANTTGVTELRTNLDLGTPELQLSIQEVAALSYGLRPDEVASAVFSESRGLFAGQFRYDNDPVPIRVRSTEGKRSQIEVVENQFVYSQQQATPLHQLAAITPAWTPTTLRHHDFDRTVTVLAQIKPGFAFNQVLADFKAKLAETTLGDDVTIEYGGDAEASEKANNNIATAVPIAVGLLIFFMMYQFNSFRRISIVFVAIPLAAVGVIPGLVFSGQPFGFQSLLGVIALIGIVVNNAIVLIDVVDQSLEQGYDIDAAVRNALENRTAPILLTSATTIVGLLPLAFSSSTLWPPMAWAIISGLSLSTILTLVAIPALCTLLLGKQQDQTPEIQRTANTRHTMTSLASTVTAIVVVGFLFGAQSVRAQQTLLIDVPKVLDLVQNNLGVQAISQDAQAAEFAYQAQRRDAWGPKLSVGGELSRRNEAAVIQLPSPLGVQQVVDKSSYVYAATLTQPLFNPSKQRFGTRAARKQYEATDLQAQAKQHRSTGRALLSYYQALSLQQVDESLSALEKSLEARLSRITKELAAGRALKTDRLQVEVAINRVKQDRIENQNAQTTIITALKNTLNVSFNQRVLLSPLLPEQTFIPDLVQPTDLSCYTRKDCLALEREVEALDAQKKSVKASYLPTIDLTLSEIRSDGQLFTSEKDRRALLAFSWPIFSGGQRLSQVKSINAKRNAALQRIQAFQQQVQLDHVNAAAMRRNAISQVSLANSSLALDRERLRLSRQRYESGLLNVDELLDAEASFERSKSDLVRAQLSEQMAITELLLATGQRFLLR